MRYIFFLLLIFTMAQAQVKIKEGMWRGVLSLDTKNHIDLPFTFNVFYVGGEPTITIFNAEENIVVDEIKVTTDSAFFYMPVFDSEFRLKLFPGMMQGKWINHSKKENNSIAFEAIFGQAQRFTPSSLVRSHFDGRWQTTFGYGTPDSSRAIGVFKQNMQKVTGTFLTETGDYRYLEGVADGTALYLSTFDGAHAFLFIANIDEKGMLHGTFYSGATGKEKWEAFKNDKSELHDPYSIVKIMKREPLEFSYRNTAGKKISLSDEKYTNKVVIVQVMGSWCPNCVDETAYLRDVYRRYASKGLEIIALAYERSADFEKAKVAVQRLKDKFAVPYEFLITCLSGSESAQKSLPVLSKIAAFPTTLFLNRKHEIAKVYTGYNGPATGPAYLKMKEDTENLLNDLLK